MIRSPEPIDPFAAHQRLVEQIDARIRASIERSLALRPATGDRTGAVDHTSGDRGIGALDGAAAEAPEGAVDRSFHAVLLDAASRLPRAPRAPEAPLALIVTIPPSKVGLPPSKLFARPAPADATGEDALIERVADRFSVDAAFLKALRHAENGGPGREFGVLSVLAPTYAHQARVAAESVRRSLERFEHSGRPAIEPRSGRYSEEFIRFFSSRYAPVGAGNDPAGLNRHHARNLSRLYAALAGTAGASPPAGAGS
jgi:hypothetical protein